MKRSFFYLRENVQFHHLFNFYEILESEPPKWNITFAQSCLKNIILGKISNVELSVYH